jgi:nitrite reductase/ring-hydroxylating ferredoxin subunit
MAEFGPRLANDGGMNRQMPGHDSIQGGLVVANASDIPHGASRKFRLGCGGKMLDGFVINFKGRFYAYINRCCHIPIPLDWIDNEFFTRDQRHLICHTHGATYEPNTGLCIDGPCPGEYLDVIPVAVKQGQVIVYCPPEWD